MNILTNHKPIIEL